MSAVLVPYAGKASRGSWHDQARVLRMNGAHVSHISAMFGVSAKAVYQVIKGVECPVNHRRNGARIAAAAPRIKRHGGFPGKRPRWGDPSHDAFIRDHYNADLSAGQIAKHLGLSRDAVIGRAHRLGLSVPT